MEKLMRIIGYFGLSIFINLIELIVFTFIYVNFVFAFANPPNELIDYTYFALMAIMFITNLIIARYLVNKRGFEKSFYLHILISILAYVPLIMLIGAFFR